MTDLTHPTKKNMIDVKPFFWNKINVSVQTRDQTIWGQIENKDEVTMQQKKQKKRKRKKVKEMEDLWNDFTMFDICLGSEGEEEGEEDLMGKKKKNPRKKKDKKERVVSKTLLSLNRANNIGTWCGCSFFLGGGGKMEGGLTWSAIVFGSI